MEEHTFHKGKVKPMKIWPGMTTNELVNEMSKSGSFMSGMLAKSVDAYEEMVKSNSYIFLTLSGALVPAGMNKVIIELIERGLVNSIVTTGANLVHDMMLAYGGNFYKGDANMRDDDLLEKCGSFQEGFRNSNGNPRRKKVSLDLTKIDKHTEYVIDNE